MAKNWALLIGINKYDNLQPLNYAKQDAQLMQEFLCKEAGFEKVFFFSDDSPDVDGQSTRPSRTNLLRVLRFEKPILGNGDNFWFFFSGHGTRHQERDYLMPSDGDPGDIEKTAISINYITERLRCCGADNVILILDACRKSGTRSGERIGSQTAEIARQTGVISIFSCSPNEYSFEIEELQQGAFTYALLEGLGVKGKCATVENLNHYLTRRVPEIIRNHRNEKERQTPYTIAEPITRSHLILLRQYATITDIATLKIDAYQAEVEGNLELAERLWIRVLAGASGTDMDAIKAIQRIALLQNSQVAFGSDFAKQKSISVKLVSAESISVKLVSAVGVDYSNLQQLLAAGKWQEADEETGRVMCKVAKREEEGWLRDDDIKNFPCEDLSTIDRLWVKYSNGRFGFSVQKRIWESVRTGYKDFYDRVGWDEYSKSYSDLTFFLNARVGYLPFIRRVAYYEAWTLISSLFSHQYFRGF
ncbi:GUN4 domain-containing protein [Floridanema evergladense]|uniref:GUN4 domain-containing protein n=1 Tax=Floridaenema evergladense BLCC-F167 TaxID=3153639 RepID=A0ABV4WL96_9CYAN